MYEFCKREEVNVKWYELCVGILVLILISIFSGLIGLFSFAFEFNFLFALKVKAVGILVIVALVLISVKAYAIYQRYKEGKDYVDPTIKRWEDARDQYVKKAGLVVKKKDRN